MVTSYRLLVSCFQTPGTGPKLSASLLSPLTVPGKLISSSLLPPYALELLTIYAWEQGCGAEDFNMAEGVRLF